MERFLEKRPENKKQAHIERNSDKQNVRYFKVCFFMLMHNPFILIA